MYHFRVDVQNIVIFKSTLGSLKVIGDGTINRSIYSNQERIHKTLKTVQKKIVR